MEPTNNVVNAKESVRPTQDASLPHPKALRIESYTNALGARVQFAVTENTENIAYLTRTGYVPITSTVQGSPRTVYVHHSSADHARSILNPQSEDLTRYSPPVANAQTPTHVSTNNSPPANETQGSLTVFSTNFQKAGAINKRSNGQMTRYLLDSPLSPLDRVFLEHSGCRRIALRDARISTNTLEVLERKIGPETRNIMDVQVWIVE